MPRTAQPPKSSTFGALLFKYRMARDKFSSRYILARAATVDGSYIARCENGERSPSYPVVERLVCAMKLKGSERTRLLAAAGYFPWTTMNETVLEVADIMEWIETGDETDDTRAILAALTTTIVLAKRTAGLT